MIDNSSWLILCVCLGTCLMFFIGLLLGTSWQRIKLYLMKQPANYRHNIIDEKRFKELMALLPKLGFEERIIAVNTFFGRPVYVTIGSDNGAFWFESILPVASGDDINLVRATDRGKDESVDYAR